jgi:Ni,Fe-hydrogenase maturation factor
LAAGLRIFQEDFPQDVSVYLIEAKSLEFGWELSSPVEQAAEKVFQMVLKTITSTEVAPSTPGVDPSLVPPVTASPNP